MSLAIAANAFDDIHKGSPEPLGSKEDTSKSMPLPVLGTKYQQDADIADYRQWLSN